jgi:hypothetical protein
MTTNYHTAIATNAPVNSAVFETALASLDAGITASRSGGTLTGLNLGAVGALTISGGLVTRTLPRHTIDTEAAATTDDLTTISGGATGDVLIISAANASRVVTVKHGTGNIYLYSKIDIVLDDTDKQLMFVYGGSRWWQINGLPTTALTYPTAAPFRRPSNMPMQMTPAARTNWGYRAAAAIVQANGIAAPTLSGSAAAANQADSTYISLTSGAVIGNSAGYVTATYNLSRRGHNPKMSMILQFTDILAVRGWFGFFSAAVTTADAIAGATEAAAFRFSTVATDAGFVPVTKDATTQTTGSAMNTIAAATRYLLEIELTASAAIFTVNNGTPVSVATTLPTTTTELGLNTIVFTTAAVAKVWQLGRVFVEQD